MVYRNGVKVGWHLIEPCPFSDAKIMPDKAIKISLKIPMTYLIPARNSLIEPDEKCQSLAKYGSLNGGSC